MVEILDASKVISKLVETLTKKRGYDILKKISLWMFR